MVIYLRRNNSTQRLFLIYFKVILSSGCHFYMTILIILRRQCSLCSVVYLAFEVAELTLVNRVTVRLHTLRLGMKESCETIELLTINLQEPSSFINAVLPMLNYGKVLSMVHWYLNESVLHIAQFDVQVNLIERNVCVTELIHKCR
jgi:hypothetical protein